MLWLLKMNSRLILTLGIIGCLYFFTMQIRAEEDRKNHLPLMSELLDKAAHNHPEEINKIKSEYPAFIEYSDQQIQLINSGAQQPQISWGEDLLEGAKVIGMLFFSAALYDIALNLVKNRFKSCDSVRMHRIMSIHNNNFHPFIKNLLILLYVFLGDTLDARKSILLSGIAIALVGRFSPFSEELNWQDLLPFVAFLKTTQLAISSLAGAASLYFAPDIPATSLVYISPHPQALSKLIAASQWFDANISLAIIMISIFHSPRNKVSSSLTDEYRGFTKALTKLFKNNPNDPELQALTLLNVISPYQKNDESE